VKFDRIVITAANAAQARGYRALTAGPLGRLAPHVTVVADPGGRRVGSLGSTVHVLRRLAAAGVTSGRVLVCHSGGDSKRLPAYAALGKAFVPMPDGRSLFEHIVALMERLPPAPGVTVCCGDVVPRLDPRRVRWAACGVTGVAYPDGPWQAQRHGVYVTRQEGATGLLPVADFLQKPHVTRGRHLIDTGILHIDWPTAARMRRLPIAGDIYEEFPRLLLDGFAPFHASVVPECSFFHVGSSRELLSLLGRDGRRVDACQAPIARLGGDNLVTFVPASCGPVSLAKGECLTCLPLGAREWYPLRYRIDDDFKRDGTWDRLGLGDLMKRVNHRRLLALRDDGAVTVELPLRIDLAGGWSDTPPICNEMGGNVFNAAVRLEGARPVKVTVRRLPAREVRVESVDLGKRGVLRTMREIRAPKDAHDWCALVKSALTVTAYDLKEGGLDIRISADVPKGSGLGTSSILGAATLIALQRLRGRASDPATVSELTLRLEREMGTGGGWQDQMGALVPGVKLVSSRPGAVQKIRVRRLPAKAERAFAEFLRERAVLYFTGRKRMARNVLRGVLDFYRANPEGLAHAVVRRLKSDASAAFRAVEKGDWAAFCAALDGYWRAKKALDPGSTNPLIESIIARMAPWTAAVGICGAGGGGFMLLVARDARAKARMKAVFAKSSPAPQGRVYEFSLDTEGQT